MAKIIIMICAAFLVNGACAQKSGLNDATVRFKVVDDNGNPVTNANIFACSLSNHKGVGNTDTNGLFSYVARSVYSIMYCNIVKEEYYRTKGDAWHWKNWGEVPSNTLPVVMKRIINPVPMLKKSAVLYFPKLEEPVGFDFEVGDWVAPYGKGRCSDVWMTGQWIDVNADQFDLHASRGIGTVF